MYIKMDMFFWDKKLNIIYNISGEFFVIEIISEINCIFLRIKSCKLLISCIFGFSMNIFKI